MRHRELGRTGIEISEIGYGAWGIGGSQWGGADDDESITALHRAIDLGLDFVDTALAYGGGRSERIVGRVVRERSETVHVATKVPPKNLTWPAPDGVAVGEVFPGEHIRACTERSLENLGLDRIDLLQLHVWSDEWVDQGDWRETVEELRAQGRIRFFGVSLNDHQPANGLRLVESGAVDTVQVIYNVFDQSPEDELFPACREHQVGVIARVPFDEGGLTGTIGPDTEFAEGDFRAHYFGGDRRRELEEHVQAILDDLGIERSELPEVALRYVLSEPTVSTVIPGMRSIRNVERNLALSEAGPLQDDRLERLHPHRWVRDYYTAADARK
jgi:aryl-alcohol dehydrogenase-like predicted oxidoreductase